MVDMSAYNDLHHREIREDPEKEYLGDDEMSRIELPSDPFVFLLPAEVREFGFHDKKWRRLSSHPCCQNFY